MRYLKASREELQAPKGKFRIIEFDVNEVRPLKGIITFSAQE
jgi:hypothetical protein